MSNGFELHDSSLLGIDLEAEQVSLDATTHRFVNDPERHEAGLQEIVLRIPGLAVAGEIPFEERDIYWDEVRLGSLEYNGLFPAPFEFVGPVHFLLTFRDGSELSFSGQGLTIQASGPFRFERLFNKPLS